MVFSPPEATETPLLLARGVVFIRHLRKEDYGVDVVSKDLHGNVRNLIQPAGDGRSPPLLHP